MILDFGRHRRPVPSAPLVGVSPVRVLQLGDSLTAESVVRRAIQREVQRHAPHVDFVGTRGLDATTGGIVGSTDMAYWGHDGVGGDTIEMCTARIAAIAAALGEARAPHIIIDRNGTNNVQALQSLSTMLAAKRAHIAALRTTWPNAWIAVDSIPTWRSGSSSGASWADKKALRDAYVAALPGIVAEFPRCSFIDGYGGTAPGSSHPPQEILADGVHGDGNEEAYRRDGTRCGREILRLMGIQWERKILRSTTGEAIYVPARRKAQAAIVLDDSGTSGVTWASDADLAPGANSFALTFWIRFASLDTGLHTIAGLNPTYPSGYMIAHDGDGLSCYVGNAGAVFAGTAGYSDSKFAVDTDYHVAIVFDRSNAYVGWALNGKTIQIVNLNSPAYGGVNWNLSASTCYVGKLITALPGFHGTIKGVAFYKGASAPTIFDLARFAQQTYVDGIHWDGLSALFRLNEGTGAPAEAAGATGTGTLTGAAAWGTW